MWYVLKCRDGQEEALVRSCTGRIAPDALEAAFLFRCERLWRSEGAWKRVERLMFPGYVFLQSSNPGRLSEALKPYRDMHMVMEDPDYLFPVYEEEEQALRRLCGKRHFLKLSYGYRDRESGRDCITQGPLKGLDRQIRELDWHRRFARVEMALAKRTAVLWAGIGLDERRIQNGAQASGK